VKEKKLDLRLVEALAYGKTIRENADYYGNFSDKTAESLILSAEDFLSAANQIIES